MKKAILTIITTLYSIWAFAHTEQIAISQIPGITKLSKDVAFVQKNEPQLDHFSPEWKYEISKPKMTAELASIYSRIDALPAKNSETYLLLGDIAHFLYNLDEQKYYELAVKNYKLAAKNNTADYRPTWFLANHYAQSNNPKQATELYLQAERALPAKNVPSIFWGDYAFAFSVAGMTSHALYAFERTKQTSGETSYFENALGEQIRKRLQLPEVSASYPADSLWHYYDTNIPTFVCRALGLRFSPDTTWRFNFGNYENKGSYFTLKSPALKGYKNAEIGATIAVIASVEPESKTLADHTQKFIGRYKNAKQIFFPTKYDKILAYEIKTPDMYQDQGGGHMYLVTIERELPQYPGLILELPSDLPQENSGNMQFYKLNNSLSRFPKKIYYTVLLDACESIHQQAYASFQDFLEKQLIIE